MHLVANETRPAILDPTSFDELETPVIPRHLQRSGISFAVSTVVHLVLFLVLAMIISTSSRNGIITLEVESTEDSSDLSNDAPPSIELDNPAAMVEIAEAELQETLFEDSLLDAEEPLVDWSTLEPVSFDDSAWNASLVETGLSEEKNASGAGFFGIETTGDRIIYLIDMSPSMQEGYKQRRFDRAVDEVLKSVNQLEPRQQFLVIMFSFRMLPMSINGTSDYCEATEGNKAALADWLGRIRLNPGTDPREALVAALSKDPTCCFLLSDGEFNGKFFQKGRFGGGLTAVQLARKHNRYKCPIHTIGLENAGSQKDMTTIAKQSGGVYKFIE